ncbi:ABC transporter transmembrane domain-containing protein [Paenibacillus silviterrae]|uniref:ABC transporter transmembrane domain-containing protein n=1 Tax=Paenibacillus silviterrae TaxID=3242194 RepID=UPI0025435511|nr:ABC transporter ATP-binding protein [Paenibacillus chinjuensis]
MSEDFEWEIDSEAVRRARPIKRLFTYALLYKKTIIMALVMLVIAIAAELTGPFIAKRIIDEHIAGIEKPWYQVKEGTAAAIFYDGVYWKRGDRVPEHERGGEGRVRQEGGTFYFARMNSDMQEKEQPLSKEQLFDFYKPEFTSIYRLVLIFGAMTVISALFSYGQRYWLQTSANRIIRRMRDDVFAHINRLPIRFFDNLPAGKVVSRITNDTDAIKDLYVTVLANFFSGILYIVAILGAMLLLDYRLALICLLVIPVLALWIVIYRKFASHYNRVIRSTLSEMNGMINESIQGMPIIQAFRKEKMQEEEFEAFNQRYYQFRNKLLHLNSLTSHNLVGALRNMAFVAMIWYFSGVSLGTVTGGISLGVLYAFVDLMNRMFQPVVNIVNQLPNLEQALVSADRVFVLMNEEGEDVSDRNIPRYRGNVTFDKVWFSYAKGEPVLKGISFEAKQGQTIALVGHTGSGKSSILNLLFRFYDVDKGSITIDGYPIESLPRQTLRKHMGIVLQDPFLFTGTIASNVSLDNPSISTEQIVKALHDVGAAELLTQLPRGINEPVIEKGSTLSAGQRQLISFARALAFDPAILILDEATSNIDSETEAIIQKALDVVKKGRTTFVIAHRLSTVKAADLILVLDRGEIIERGTHNQLMAQQGQYYQMYELQQGNGKAVAVI